MKNKGKILIDIVLAITFVLLFNAHVPGLTFHEIAGIAIGLGILVHILLDTQWIKEVTLRLIDPKLPSKTRLGYLLNILLLISFIAIIVSGLFISKILFPNLRIGYEAWFITLHVSLSYITLILIGIHIGLHGTWLLSFFKNLFRIKSGKLTSMIARLLIVIILLFGGYQIVVTNFVMKIAGISNVFTITDSEKISKGMEHKYQDRSQKPANGQQKQFHHGGRGPGEGRKGQSRSSNLFGIILEYSGIMGFFAILTYYMEKLLARRKTN